MSEVLSNDVYGRTESNLWETDTSGLGSQVALRVRDIVPSLPILMITGYLEKLGDCDKPVDAVIGKPFAIDDLRRAIAKLLP